MNQPVGTASSPIGLWIWLFPLAYGLHIAEEYWLHFPKWVSQLSRSFVSNPQFLFPTRTYSPGAITAVFLYLPLVIYTFRRVLPRVTRGLALRAVALGAAIHAGVMLLAAHPSLLPSM
jgi:hypothetical protein